MPDPIDKAAEDAKRRRESVSAEVETMRGIGIELDAAMPGVRARVIAWLITRYRKDIVTYCPHAIGEKDSP